MPFCSSIASPLSNHQTIEVTLNRFFRLIILLAIPVAFSLAVYLQDKPVQAAGGDKQKSDQMVLEAEGRDVLVIDGDTITGSYTHLTLPTIFLGCILAYVRC